MKIDDRNKPERKREEMAIPAPSPTSAPGASHDLKTESLGIPREKLLQAVLDGEAPPQALREAGIKISSLREALTHTDPLVRLRALSVFAELHYHPAVTTELWSSLFKLSSQDPSTEIRDLSTLALRKIEESMKTRHTSFSSHLGVIPPLSYLVAHPIRYFEHVRDWCEGKLLDLHLYADWYLESRELLHEFRKEKKMSVESQRSADANQS